MPRVALLSYLLPALVAVASAAAALAISPPRFPPRRSLPAGRLAPSPARDGRRPPTARRRATRRGRVLVAGIGLLVIVSAGSPVMTAVLGVGVVAVVRALPRARVRRAEHASAAQLVADLPDAVDLVAVAASAGCNVRLAVEAVAVEGDGPVAVALREAMRDVAAGGRLADALARLPCRFGDGIRPLVDVLVDSDRYGTPLGPATAALAVDLRLLRQRRVEERARRIPVRLLLPLVVCVLPAFALLTVAPLLAGGIRSLAPDTFQQPIPEAFP